jgi:hypothetical protein
MISSGDATQKTTGENVLKQARTIMQTDSDNRTKNSDLYTRLKKQDSTVKSQSEYYSSLLSDENGNFS